MTDTPKEPNVQSERPPVPAAVEIRRVTVLQSDLPKLVIAGQLSMRTSFSLRVDGHFEGREMAALTKIIAAQLEILAEPNP